MRSSGRGLAVAYDDEDDNLFDMVHTVARDVTDVVKSSGSSRVPPTTHQQHPQASLYTSASSLLPTAQPKDKEQGAAKDAGSKPSSGKGAKTSSAAGRKALVAGAF